MQKVTLGNRITSSPRAQSGCGGDVRVKEREMTPAPDLFAALSGEVAVQTPLRAAITAAYRRPETKCLPPLLDLATLSADENERVEALARDLVARLRAKRRLSGVEGLIHEYSL